MDADYPDNSRNGHRIMEKRSEILRGEKTDRAALDMQEGGDHYKTMVIQPVEFCQKNRLPYIESNVIKYVCRHGSKNGKEDIKKAIHYLELLLELEYT